MAETVITTVAMHAKTMNVTLSAVFFDIYATAREIICTAGGHDDEDMMQRVKALGLGRCFFVGTIRGLVQSSSDVLQKRAACRNGG